MANLLRLIKNYDEFRDDTEQKDRDGAAARGKQAPLPEQPEQPPVEPPEPPSADATPQQVAGVEPPSMPPPLPTVAPPTPFLEPVAPPMGAPVMPGSVAPARASSETPAKTAQALSIYERALVAVSRMFEAAVMEDITRGRLRSTIAELEQLAPELVHTAIGDRGLLRKAMGTYAEGEGFVIPHSVNVAVLEVDLGRELGLTEQNLLDLCMAGLVHDLGSIQLPQGLLTKSESLTPSEWDEMRARPTYTYETLRKLDGAYERVAEITHQVYERLDGSGYPRGLQGDEILPEARILGTVDFFESFAHPRPYKTTLPGTANHGIQMLMQMADKFGASTLKALIGSIGLFPIGSYVRLSSGEIGRVVDVTKENPMRPEVEVLLDSGRRPPATPRTLDLLAIPHIYVSRALTASDLRELGLLPPPSRMPSRTEPENGPA